MKKILAIILITGISLIGVHAQAAGASECIKNESQELWSFYDQLLNKAAQGLPLPRNVAMRLIPANSDFVYPGEESSGMPGLYLNGKNPAIFIGMLSPQWHNEGHDCWNMTALRGTVAHLVGKAILHQAVTAEEWERLREVTPKMQDGFRRAQFFAKAYRVLYAPETPQLIVDIPVLMLLGNIEKELEQDVPAEMLAFVKAKVSASQ